MRALVTGCAGFIGSHLARSLLEDGHDVLGIDCFTANYARRRKLDNVALLGAWDGFEFRAVDLSLGDLGEVPEGCDAVFHLAAEPGAQRSWGARFGSYVRNNIVATQHLLEALVAHPGARLVLASSSSVYGQAERLPTAEDVAPAPITPYGATKLHGEQLLDVYRRCFGVEATTLRYFSVYGPRQRPDMAFAIFCRRMLDGEQLELFGGDQSRDFTHVSDVVAATLSAAVVPAAAGGVFNVGGGTRIALRDAVATLAEIAGRPPAVRVTPRVAGDVRDTAADITRAAAILGYVPRVGLQEGLADQWAWAGTDRRGVGAA